jgi:glycosyltransferase involved in cell wall biosynthesis
MNDNTDLAGTSNTFRRLRIAVVGMRGLPSTYSGIERIGEQLYPALRRRGHKITVFGRKTHMTEAVNEFRGVNVVQTSTIDWQPLETLSQAFSSFFRASQRGEFDVVHVHAEAPALLLMGYWLKRIPTVWTIHGLDWQRARWKGAGSMILKQAERSGVRFADQIIVVSNALKEYFWRQYNRHTNLVYNALTSELVATECDNAAITRHELQPQHYVIFVGRLVPEKRVDDLINAFRQLKTDSKLVVIGTGSPGYVSYLKMLAELDRRIIFTGLLERPALAPVFRSAAAYVSASELEGFPMSLLECVEHSVPAVVSDIAPHRELLEGVARYDLFFRVGDLSALSARLSSVLNNPRHYQEVAQTAREHLHKKFPFEKMVDSTENIFLKAFHCHKRVSNLPS